MLTFITVPKAFSGHIGTIQTNAILSWLHLPFGPEIILFGNEAGVGEFARRHGVKHIPDIECNERGTPYLDSVFASVAKHAHYDQLCFINTDVILLDDFMQTISRVWLHGRFVIGRRTNLDVTQPLDFGALHWQRDLRARVKQEGRLQGPNAIDYFLFLRHPDLLAWPRFLIGRGVWDNWFVNRARSLGFKLVDATSAISAIHQNHDYSHIKDVRGGAWEGPESDWNRQLAGAATNIGTVFDAQEVIVPGGWCLPALGCAYVQRRVQRWAERVLQDSPSLAQWRPRVARLVKKIA